MKWLILIVIIILAFIIIRHNIRQWLKNKTDVVTAFSGGMGSGKTILSVDKSFTEYKKALKKFSKNKKLFDLTKKSKYYKKITAPLYEDLPYNEKYIEKPVLISNIPLKIKNNEYCFKLKYEHLTLQERIPQRSIILIDEIGAFADQFRYKDANIVNTFNEFVRFARHYLDCKIICNDQCSENINLHIRRRINTITNLQKCFVIGPFCLYFKRDINISEEIKTIDTADTTNENNNKSTTDNMELKCKLVLHKKKYDTRCYRHRYDSVPSGILERYGKLTTNHALECPSDKDIKLISKTKKGD